MRTLTEIQQTSLVDSKFWFPDVHRTDHDAIVHFSLGIAGEVGELVNFIKKINRGSLTYEQANVQLSHEMADVLIYLCDIAETLHIDLDQAVQDKRKILVSRWGEPVDAVMETDTQGAWIVYDGERPSPGRITNSLDGSWIARGTWIVWEYADTFKVLAIFLDELEARRYADDVAGDYARVTFNLWGECRLGHTDASSTD